MSDSVLVAGATGAVGRRLCGLLVADGWSVIGTTRTPHRVPLLRALGVEPVIVDVFDRTRLGAVMSETRPTIVIHQLTDLPPGLDPARMSEGRVRTARLRGVGTRNLVSAAVAAGVRRMIAQSIAFAYAPGPTPYDESWPLDTGAAGDLGLTVRAVASLERQLLDAPFESVILRYGRLYGPGTGFDDAPRAAPLHVDGAADAARLAVTRGNGIYNIAEDDGAVSTRRAGEELGWRAGHAGSSR